MEAASPLRGGRAPVAKPSSVRGGIDMPKRFCPPFFIDTAFIVNCTSLQLLAFMECSKAVHTSTAPIRNVHVGMVFSLPTC